MHNSIPPFKVYGRILKWPTRGDCKSPGATLHRFESCSYHHFFVPKTYHVIIVSFWYLTIRSRGRSQPVRFLGLQWWKFVRLYWCGTRKTTRKRIYCFQLWIKAFEHPSLSGYRDQAQTALILKHTNVTTLWKRDMGTLRIEKEGRAYFQIYLRSSLLLDLWSHPESVFASKP